MNSNTYINELQCSFCVVLKGVRAGGKLVSLDLLQFFPVVSISATYPQVGGFSKYGGHFPERTKAPAATQPQVRGCHFSETIKNRLRQRTHKLGASKSMGAICLIKKCLRQCTHKGFQKYGGHFSGRKAPAATYPQVGGFQKYGGLFSNPS